jgi:hypothetical protein
MLLMLLVLLLLPPPLMAYPLLTLAQHCCSGKNVKSVPVAVLVVRIRHRMDVGRQSPRRVGDGGARTHDHRVPACARLIICMSTQ